MRVTLLLLVLAAFVSACATGLTVHQRLLSDADVGQWQRYAWKDPIPASVDPQVRAASERIRQEVDGNLANKGYRKTTKNQAQFLVSHAIYTHWEVPEVSAREERAARELELQSVESDHVPRPGREVGLHESGEGALLLFVAGADGAAVWEGRVETPLNYHGAGLKRLPVAVQKLLAEFPSRGE